MPLAVFRADASIASGGGHVMRCRALAGGLRDLGWDCQLASMPDTRDVIPDLDEFIVMSGREEADIAALKKQWPSGVDLMVVDHYGLGASFEAACRPWAKSMMAIDDLANRTHDCDILLDHTPARRPEDYADLVPSNCTTLTGSDYALLRLEFLAIPQRPLTPAGRVLIALGTTDQNNMTGRLLDILSQVPAVKAIDVLLGAAAPHLQAITRQAATLTVPTTVQCGLSSVAPLMAGCDMAVGAAGVSALERCAAGLPSAMIVLADNQRVVAGNLAELGAALLLDAADLEPFADTVAAMLGDAEKLTDMSQKALALCDGRGVNRAAMALAPEKASDGGAIRLRPATMEDAPIMLHWQSVPETRRHAHNPTVPSRPKHMAWCRRKITDPACLVNLILHQEVPAGVLRLDYDTEQEGFVVSILVAPDKYRLGLGRAALTLARRLVPEALLIAQIHGDNAASLALFKSCGFTGAHGQYVQKPATDASSLRERAHD